MPLQTDKIPDSGHRTDTVDGTRHQNITCHADFMAWQVINWKTELTRHTAVCYTIHNCKCRKRKSLGFYGASAAMVTNTIFSSYFLEFFFGFPAGQHCTRDFKRTLTAGVQFCSGSTKKIGVRFGTSSLQAQKQWVWFCSGSSVETRVRFCLVLYGFGKRLTVSSQLITQLKKL